MGMGKISQAFPIHQINIELGRFKDFKKKKPHCNIYFTTKKK